MDWTTYKACCDKPYVFSRWALLTTAVVLPVALAAPMMAIMQAESLPKPEGHTAPPELDMFVLKPRQDLNKEYVRAVRQVLAHRSHRYLSDQLRAGQIEHLLVVWREFANYLDAS